MVWGLIQGGGGLGWWSGAVVRIDQRAERWYGGTGSGGPGRRWFVVLVWGGGPGRWSGAVVWGGDLCRSAV